MNKIFLIGSAALVLFGCLTEPESDNAAKYRWEQTGALNISDTTGSGDPNEYAFVIWVDTVKSAPVESLYVAAGRAGEFTCDFEWWIGDSPTTVTNLKAQGYAYLGENGPEGNRAPIILYVPRAGGYTHYRLEFDCSEHISDED